MSDLVRRLSEGQHRVEVDRVESAKELKERIDRGLVLVKFVGTQGGTELGIRIDPAACRYEDVDFDVGRGTATLVGTLTLDFVKVRCVVDLDVQSRSGQGHLEPI